MSNSHKVSLFIRVSVGVLFYVGVFVAPWWSVLVGVLIFSFCFRNYYEGVVWVSIIGILYFDVAGTGEQILFFSFPVLGVATMMLVEKFKRQLLHYYVT